MGKKIRFSHKKFDNAYDRCWVSVPKSDLSFKNGMDNPKIKEDILNLYRYKCTGECTKHFERWIELTRQGNMGSDLENALFCDLHYFYCYDAVYEWWKDGKRVNWFDPQEDNTWQQVLDGCEPLFKLFEELGEES